MYYEKYADESYGFSGGGVNHLQNDRTVILDGYAVAYSDTDFSASLGVALDVTYLTETGGETTKGIHYSYGDGNMYTITGTNPLTDREET